MVKQWIAILGSADANRTDLGLKHVDESSRAARQIGCALAEKECGIVVYASTPEFIEHHVVAGYIESGKATSESIRVIYSRHTSSPQFNEERTHGGCFKHRIDQNEKWEVSFYRSLYDVDGVFLLGGGQSTFIAGILATIRRMPIVALEGYGGAAARVWELVNPYEGLVTDEEKSAMAEVNTTPVWARQMVDLLLAQKQRLTDAERQKQTLRKRRDKRLLSQAAAGIVLLAVSLLLFIATWDAQLDRIRLLSALIAAPALAGTAASIVRSLWDQVVGDSSISERPVVIMALLGCAAGIISGLLYIVAQLTAMAPAEAGKSMPVAASRLVPFALLTGFLAGFATDAFFRKMRDREVRPVEVPVFRGPGQQR